MNAETDDSIDAVHERMSRLEDMFNDLRQSVEGGFAELRQAHADATEAHTAVELARVAADERREERLAEHRGRTILAIVTGSFAVLAAVALPIASFLLGGMAGP